MQGDWDLLDMPPYFIADVQDADPNLLERIQPLLYLGAFRAQAAVPMQVKEQINGRVILSYDQPHTFTLTEQQLLTTLADQAAISLDNFVLVQQTQESLEETAILYQTSRSIANAASAKEEIDAVVDFAVPPFVTSVLTLNLVGGNGTIATPPFRSRRSGSAIPTASICPERASRLSNSRSGRSSSALN